MSGWVSSGKSLSRVCDSVSRAVTVLGDSSDGRMRYPFSLKKVSWSAVRPEDIVNHVVFVGRGARGGRIIVTMVIAVVLVKAPSSSLH